MLLCHSFLLCNLFNELILAIVANHFSPSSEVLPVLEARQINTHIGCRGQLLLPKRGLFLSLYTLWKQGQRRRSRPFPLRSLFEPCLLLLLVGGILRYPLVVLLNAVMVHDWWGYKGFQVFVRAYLS